MRSVLVAGVSRLAAADRLQERGYDVTVLEAEEPRGRKDSVEWSGIAGAFMHVAGGWAPATTKS